MENTPIIAAEALALAFTVEPAPFAAAVDFLARRIVEPRNTLPILSTVRIEAAPGGALRLTGTDLDNWASITLAADVEAPGGICIDALALLDVMAKVKKDKSGHLLSICEVDGRAVLKFGRGSFRLHALPVDDFPDARASFEAAPYMLPAGQALADFAALEPVICKESQRYYLCGVAIQLRELAGVERLAMVATDGANMAVAAHLAPIGGMEWPDLILPGKAVTALRGAAKLASDAEALALGHGKGPHGGDYIRLGLGAVEIVSKVIDGTYPDWARIWQEGGPLAPSGGMNALFPDLLPGAPVAVMEKLAKACKASIVWEPAAQGFIGTVSGNDRLIFGTLAMKGWECGRKGYDYTFTGHSEAQAYLAALADSAGLPSAAYFEAEAARIAGEYQAKGQSVEPINGIAQSALALIHRGGKVQGLTVGLKIQRPSWVERVQDWENLVEREIYHPALNECIEGSYSVVMPAARAALEPESYIDGPDDLRYPVADNGAAIHMSKEQVRALVGESCFETMAITLPGGARGFILKWLWDQGDSRFLTVNAKGRTYAGGVYVTRAEIEAAGMEAEAKASAATAPRASKAQETQEALTPAMTAPEPENALSAPEIEATATIDPFAEIAARLAALESHVATLSAGNMTPAMVGGDVTPSGGMTGEVIALPTEGAAERLAQVQERQRADRTRRELMARRYLAMRAERNALRERLAIATAQNEGAEGALWAEWDHRRKNAERARRMVAKARAERDKAKALVLSWRGVALKAKQAEEAVMAKRTASAQRARRMIASARATAAERGTQAEAIRAALASLRAKLADPNAPERASDIARLVQERDTARRALAAVEQRNKAMQGALDSSAATIESFGLRLAKAEAAVRRMAA